MHWPVLWVSLTQAEVITENGASLEEMRPWDPAIRHFLKNRGEGERAPCGWCHLWAGRLGFYKKANRASQGKQASKQYPSMASASAPASWPAWVPVLTSLVMNSIQYGSVSRINPFLPNLLLGHDVLCRDRNPDKDSHHAEIWPLYSFILCFSRCSILNLTKQKTNHKQKDKVKQNKFKDELLSPWLSPLCEVLSHLKKHRKN